MRKLTGWNNFLIWCVKSSCPCTLGGSLNIWSRQINSRQGSNSTKWENDSSLMAWQRTSVRSTRRLHLDWSENKTSRIFSYRHFNSVQNSAVCDQRFTCDPVVGIMKVRTVVDKQILNISEHLVHHFYANISNDARVLHNVSQPVLHQLWVTHLTCIWTRELSLNFKHFYCLGFYTSTLPILVHSHIFKHIVVKKHPFTRKFQLKLLSVKSIREKYNPKQCINLQILNSS